MLKVVQKKLYNSVKVFWLDKELLDKTLREIVERVSKTFREIKKIILFGYQVENRATPFSDVDIL